MVYTAPPSRTCVSLVLLLPFSHLIQCDAGLLPNAAVMYAVHTSERIPPRQRNLITVQGRLFISNPGEGLAVIR